MKHRFYIGLMLTAVIASGSPASAKQPLYKNSAAPVEQRVKDLLSRMTVEEKVAQLEAQTVSLPLSPGAVPTAVGLFEGGKFSPEVARKTLGEGIGAFALVGIDPVDAIDGARQQNQIQKWVIEHTRLGIPVIFYSEALHGAGLGRATSFPQAIGLGSTWNPDLVHQIFDVVGRQARAGGISQVLAPVLDLARDPRFGRVEEMYSEDPFLTGTMGVAAVQGLQGGSAGVTPDHVVATAKHFVHGQPQRGMNLAASDFSERTMRSVFFVPFEMAVKQAAIGSVMPSYNENFGGVPSHADSWMLREVLRKEWGFSGMIVSDWGGIPKLKDEHRLAATKEVAGRMALAAGVDMELPSPVSYPSLIDGVRSGEINISQIDEAVGRVLKQKFAAGLFERPYADLKKIESVLEAPEAEQLARQAANEAIILLKNNGGMLPLDPARLRSVAVVGPNADKMRLGTYSGKPSSFVSVLDGIKQRLGSSVAVRYAEGVRISEPDSSPYMNRIIPYQAPDGGMDERLIAEAVEAARGSDVVILVLGGNETVSREAFGAVDGNEQLQAAKGDSDNLELPGRQNDLVREVAKLGKPMIAILINGRPYSPEQLDKAVPAILEGWYLGQDTGAAVARVLFGDVSPSGRLPVTIARNVGQLPAFYYKTPASRMGYVFSNDKPLYPFGFGLSYTSFAYSKPVVDKSAIRIGESARVSVNVTNTGSRAGDDVVQMYMGVRGASVVQPIARLAGFRRVHLKPGETQAISFDVGPEQFAIWGRGMKRSVENSMVDIQVGPNSEQTESVSLQIGN